MTGLKDLVARRPFAVALLAALALLLVPYRTLLGPGVPAGRDLVPYFYPLKTQLVEALRAGEMPWVDRFRWGGLPLLSWPGVSAFDPGNVLFLLLPTALAAKGWMLLRVLTGAAGFGVFLRLAGLPPLSSALGALAWGAAGITASAASFLSTSSALAAIPWFAAALLHARSERTARSVAVLAVATALLLVPSLPEPLLVAALLALVLLAGRGERGGGLGERTGAAALWLAGGLLGALLAAPVLGAVWVTATENVRSVRGALLPGFAAQGALPASRLADLVSDGLVADWTAVAHADGVPGFPYFPSLTPGRLAWTLALLGLVAGRGRGRPLALAALGLLLALGPATPLLDLLIRVVPFASSIRYPEKYALLLGFGVLWLAALGAAALEGALPRRAATPAFVLLAGLLVLDRASITRRLIPMAPETLLAERPAVLAGLPAAARGEPPPRLLSLTGYRIPVGAAPDDPRIAGPLMTAWGVPWTPSRFGVATVFEGDYDASLPRVPFEWTLYFEKVLPESIEARLLARAAGATAFVEAGVDGSGRPVPRARRIEHAVAPFRFVERVVSGRDARALASRFLREGAPGDAAFVVRDEADRVPSPGRLLRVSDRPGGLELEVDVEGPAPGYLLACRPVVATREARVDGKPVTVEEALFGFTGLPVPPGRHVVRLQPPRRWLIIAAVLTALGLAAVTALALRGRAGGAAVR